MLWELPIDFFSVGKYDESYCRVIYSLKTKSEVAKFYSVIGRKSRELSCIRNCLD
jgi:hypothetical protein